jgi:hypothetical protein
MSWEIETARHIIPDKQPPPNPMNIYEARAFIRKVSRKWLEEKARIDRFK